MNERRYVELPNERGGIDRIAWYDSGGEGSPVLLIHGFAEFSCTWDELLGFLPENFRYIRIDVKGFGYSSKNDSGHLTLFDQAVCVAKFIRELDLQELTLIGHSMGGAIACLLLNYTDISERISKVVLIDPAGMFTDVPEFIATLALISPQNPLLRFASEDLLVYVVMSQAYFCEGKISQELLSEYAQVARLPGARECMISAARDFRIPNVPSFQADLQKHKLPALIIWGAEDRIIPLDDADKFRDCLVNSRLVVFPECGHSPQEEMPEETATLIADFLTDSTAPTLPVPSESVPVPPQTPAVLHIGQLRQLTESYKLKMRRLVDRWSFGTVFLLFFIKILQVCKKFGMRAEENGWRKATGIFLRNEYSKFVLSCFRLRFYRDAPIPDNFLTARQLLIGNLADYIRSHSQLHWSASPAKFRMGRKKIDFTDIAEAFYDKTGELLWIEMHFDGSRENFHLLTQEHIRDALRRMVINVNKLRVSECGDQSQVLAGRLRRWARRVPGYSYGARHELRSLVERLLTATFIHCELLPDDPETMLSRRLASPNLRKYRNPGWGLLNVIARFTPDFREADLWMQYHHVPVDGMPMQEILADLKNRWGCAGVLAYPAADSPAARPEILYAGNRLFRNRFFINFEPLLQLRRELNDKYATFMEGPATVAGMLIWGLSQHHFFRNCKMLFPVDSEPKSGNPAERELSLVFIRAGQYVDYDDPLDGFLNFQREFNRRLWHTRKGSSESYELLELYSMIHPVFYQIALRLMPESMGEFVGSMGLSILRDADIFISPLSDLQVNGFMTIGDLTHPTEDGKTAGAVSSCGTREQIRFYQEAMSDLAKNFRRYLAMP
ncbi:MAG: alpha/beta hydrolase [Victivallales bacterium]|nr:alpha/beta hydrolase [Victivallales bacterium]